MKNEKTSLIRAIYYKCLNSIPSRIYVAVQFKKRVGYWPNLRNPKTFNEKLCYAKLYDHNPLFTKLVDKAAVREYVESRIGSEYLTPLYGVYERPGDIPYDELPKSFVLKTNHDSGSVVLVKDKVQINREEIANSLSFSLSRNYYNVGREWPYKNVHSQIICEKYLEERITDYKFYVFHGKVKYLYLGKGLVSDHSLKICFLDENYNLVPFGRSDYPILREVSDKPNNFDEMKKLAEKLAEGLSFVRVDLFNVGGKIYFSEMTLTPASGYMPFEPAKYDLVLGEII